MSSAINSLKEAADILDLSKRHDTHLTLFDMNEKLP